jgi:hypothetical protein
MTKISKSLDEIRKAGWRNPLLVVVMKLHNNCTLSFVPIGINGILKDKILPLAVVVFIPFASQWWTLAIHFLQLFNDIMVTFICM